VSAVRWLAIDTSGGTTVGVAQTDDGGSEPVVLAELSSADARGHVEALAPMLEQALADAGVEVGDLDAVAVGTGPAPVTGLRVGLATAQAFARASGTPIHGVCSLDAIAWSRRDGDEDLVVATDARRREVYWAAYRGDGRPGEPQWWAHEPAVGPPSDVLDWIAVNGGTALGPALAIHPDLGAPSEAVVTVAGLVGVADALVRAGAPTPLAPRYLRRPDIHVGTGRKRAT
jgi:tRNA threonylcarbamoyladenosine biosynthesis protein TsaB